MKRWSLSLKLTAVFILISVAMIAQLYFGFSDLVEKRLLDVEREKAHLIAETIEPLLGMNAYLGLKDELIQQLEQAAKNPQIVGLTVYLNGEKIWAKHNTNMTGDLKVEHPIRDPVSGQPIGSIELTYASDAFVAAAKEMKRKILLQLALLSIGLLFFVVFARVLLKPLGIIANVVQAYRPGERLQFPPLRQEAETQAIVGAFGRMVDNVREHTALLERYKLSMDESSIVSRMNPQGVITYVNDEFCRVTGYSRAELIGQSFSIVRQSVADNAVDEEIWRLLGEKRIWKGTLTNRTRNNENYYVKSTIVPILDENDVVVEYVTIQHDVTQIIQQRELIIRQTTDPVTGLGNRVKLMEEIKHLGACKIALLNLDNYSVIKDYYGYDVATQVLALLAKRLCQQVSGLPVTVFKLAGSEFGLLCDDAVQMSAFHATCRGTVETIEEESIQVDGEDFLLQLSAGLSGSGDQIITHASLALQHAREYREPAIIFEQTENLIKRHEDNLLWTKRIKAALHEERIALYVQPIFASGREETEKYECLVRLIEPDGRVISPFYFLDVAKKSKLYHKISQRVIKCAFDALEQLPNVHFSINLSPDDLMHQDTIDLLHARLENRMQANRVVLEIVESEEIEKFDEITQILEKLKGKGCKIAIDDFGTGYSNFAYLMTLNVDYIKVDGSLIRDIDTNPNSQIISRTILDFARELNLETVAEFVHNEAVQHRVTAMGFNYLQGFHLGEPAPIETLLAPGHIMTMRSTGSGPD